MTRFSTAATAAFVTVFALTAGTVNNASAASVDSIALGSVAVVGAACCQTGQVFNTLQLDADANRSNYLVFDLASLAGQLGGQNIASATLTITGLFSFSITQAGTFNLYDFGGDLNALKNYGFANPPSLATATAVRDDLRQGDLYGTVSLTPGATSIVVTLSAEAIADLNNTVDGAGSKLFAIGGFSPTLTSGYNFNSSYAAVGHLDVTPTPVPAALPLFVSGIAALGAFGLRNRRKNKAA